MALKDTDTKIYKDNNRGYYKFVEGIPCFFGHNSVVFYNCTIDFDQVESNLYVFVEEPTEEATEKDKKKLCKFWNDDPSEYLIGMLCATDFEDGDNYRYCMDCPEGCWHKHCQVLSPAEVAEITGYKVER